MPHSIVLIFHAGRSGRNCERRQQHACDNNTTEKTLIRRCEMSKRVTLTKIYTTNGPGNKKSVSNHYQSSKLLAFFFPRPLPEPPPRRPRLAARGADVAERFIPRGADTGHAGWSCQNLAELTLKHIPLLKCPGVPHLKQLFPPPLPLPPPPPRPRLGPLGHSEYHTVNAMNNIVLYTKLHLPLLKWPVLPQEKHS